MGHTLSGDAMLHMAGLIVGITVHPPATWREPARPHPANLRLLVQEGARRSRSERALGYVLQRGPEPPRDSVQIAGPVLLMTRGRPTDVTVVNHLKEPTGVHWHGVELESYSDGVVGWSGRAGHVAPPIAPNDSFVAHLTLPRAGTFIYHTHLGDLEQLTSGLYGAIVVLEPGRTFDPSTDHVYVAGWDGPADPPSILVNGDSILAPVVFAAGRRHRLRFVNIGPAAFVRATIKRDTSLARWRAIAKDGADYPRDRATERPAQVVLDVGEAYDFEFDAREPGEYVLTIETLARPPMNSTRQQRIVVR
jgi:FtsP/CotA-like multicopper oxidase with cupredoxin domain